MLTTSGLATFGLEPPIVPGCMLPVRLNLDKIFETQPCETFKWREMSQGHRTEMRIFYESVIRGDFSSEKA